MYFIVHAAFVRIKLMMMIKTWTDLSTVLSQFTRVTDRQTDRQTEFSSLDRVCITCSAV